MARVSFEFKKGDFVWVSLIVVLLVSGFVVATWDSSKAMFHDSADVKVTIEGEGDMSLQDAIGGGFIGGMKFGSWVDMGTTTSGTATSDGVIVAYIPGGVSIRGSIGGVTRLVDHGAAASWGASITMPVKVSDSWEVVVSGGTPTVYWVPIINSGGSSGMSSCHTVSNEGTMLYADVTCDSGIMTGGGCHATTESDYPVVLGGYPDGNGWICEDFAPAWPRKVLTAYVRCCE